MRHPSELALAARRRRCCWPAVAGTTPRRCPSRGRRSRAGRAGRAPSRATTTATRPAPTRRPSGLPAPGACRAARRWPRSVERGFLRRRRLRRHLPARLRNPFTGVDRGLRHRHGQRRSPRRSSVRRQGHVQLRVITAADRIPLLQAGEIDIVARNMTINCTRWEQIAFSAEYFHSGQKILVAQGLRHRRRSRTSPASASAPPPAPPASTTSRSSRPRPSRSRRPTTPAAW